MSTGMLALAALMPVATVAHPRQDGWAVGARRDAEGGSDSGSGRPGDHRACGHHHMDGDGGCP